MKKSFLLLLLFTFLFSIQIYSQQAQYGFFDKYYIGILHNGQMHNYNRFDGLHLNLWCHYVMWPWGIDNGWTDLPTLYCQCLLSGEFWNSLIYLKEGTLENITKPKPPNNV